MVRLLMLAVVCGMGGLSGEMVWGQSVEPRAIMTEQEALTMRLLGHSAVVYPMADIFRYIKIFDSNAVAIDKIDAQALKLCLTQRFPDENFAMTATQSSYINKSERQFSLTLRASDQEHKALELALGNVRRAIDRSQVCLEVRMMTGPLSALKAASVGFDEVLSTGGGHGEPANSKWIHGYPVAL